MLSRLTHEHSVAGQAFEKAREEAALLASEATLSELRRVLSRPKFDRYVSKAGRAVFVAFFEEIVKPIAIRHVVRECRDPKDDMFLELALSGDADLLLTGDLDLRTLHPWRGDSVAGGIPRHASVVGLAGWGGCA